MTPTRADFERRMNQLRRINIALHEGENPGHITRVVEAVFLADVLALLTSEGPAPTCATCRHHRSDTVDCKIGVSRPIHHSLFDEWGCTLHEPAEGPETPAPRE